MCALNFQQIGLPGNTLHEVYGVCWQWCCMLGSMSVFVMVLARSFVVSRVFSRENRSRPQKALPLNADVTLKELHGESPFRLLYWTKHFHQPHFTFAEYSSTCLTTLPPGNVGLSWGNCERNSQMEHRMFVGLHRKLIHMGWSVTVITKHRLYCIYIYIYIYIYICIYIYIHIYIYIFIPGVY